MCKMDSARTPEVVLLTLSSKLSHEISIGLQGRAAGQHGLVVGAQREAFVVAAAAFVRVKYLVVHLLTSLRQPRPPSQPL